MHETHTHTHLTALCPGLPKWAGTRKVKPIWILLKQETVSGSGKSEPCSRQITMPAFHRSVFYRLDALPAMQPTVSKHWRKMRIKLFRPSNISWTLAFTILSCDCCYVVVTVPNSTCMTNSTFRWENMQAILFFAAHVICPGPINVLFVGNFVKICICGSWWNIAWNRAVSVIRSWPGVAAAVAIII